MRGFCTTLEEWLYPDQELGELPDKVVLHSAKNGRESVRLLVETSAPLSVSVNAGSDITAEIFEMIDVNVKYNEIETEEQEGMFVITDAEFEKPSYCTRKAPFRVYEALRPVKGDTIAPRNFRIALCLTFAPNSSTASGEHTITVAIGDYVLTVALNVYDVVIPDETLKVTNWFSLDNVALRHGLEIGTPAYYDMLRLYARAMRRTRQTHFFISYDSKRVTKNREKLEFDLSYLKPIIDVFFDEGFQTMEFGNFGTKHDDYFTTEIKCAIDPTVTLSSDEGYYLNQAFIKAVADFLKENGWEKKTIFHVFDEPDVHIKSAESMELRKQQYLRVTNLLRRYIPDCKTIEAVKTTRFKGGVDIWVPLTANYEEFHDDFDKLIKAGEEVWCYVCCVPTGRYLNRFLDIDLIKSRLLFWGCSKYDLSGYLHWGFNYWPEHNYNPFEESNTPNTPFNGIYPSGDAYIVFPGDDGPWIGNRLEAQRRGAEDFELLKLIKNQYPDKYDEIVKQVFVTNTDYNADAAAFENVRIEMLKLLSK